MNSPTVDGCERCDKTGMVCPNCEESFYSCRCGIDPSEGSECPDCEGSGGRGDDDS